MIKSGFFNSRNGDRKYFTSDISGMLNGIIKDGVFATIGRGFAVRCVSGFNISIDTGKAWANSSYIENTSSIPKTLEGPEVVLDRIDAVMLDFNSNESVRSNNIIVVQSEPSSKPVIPNPINDANHKQLMIAYILRKAGEKSIDPSNLHYVVGTTRTPYVTGAVTTITIDAFTSAMEKQFNEFLKNLEDNLTGNQAGQLQLQIGNLNHLKTNSKKDLVSAINELFSRHTPKEYQLNDLHMENFYIVDSFKCSVKDGLVDFNISIRVNATVLPDHLYSMQKSGMTIPSGIRPSVATYIHGVGCGQNWEKAVALVVFVSPDGNIKWSTPSIRPFYKIHGTYRL